MIERLGTYLVVKRTPDVILSALMLVFRNPLVQKKHYLIDHLTDFIFFHPKVFCGVRSDHLVPLIHQRFTHIPCFLHGVAGVHHCSLRIKDDIGLIRNGIIAALISKMLQNPSSATMAEIVAATGWQAHTARGWMSGALGKKLGLTVTSAKEESRGRVYRIG